MRSKFFKRGISILLTVLLAIGGCTPAMSALAADGVEGYYDLQIFYADNNTMVPTYGEDGETAYIEYMHEGDELNLTHKLIDSVWPDNGYVKWHSENPVLVDVTSEGVVKAFDSSKGAVIHSWIDHEVKTIPLVGSLMAKALEKIMFNEYVNLDSMDTEEIVDLLIAGFGSDSILSQYIEAYQGQLVDSLREYLDKVNTGIVCELFDAKGTLLATDVVNVTVLKNEEWYANFLPNGTHITNKAQINTTQAVKASVQLYAITTPQRLGYGTVYSVKSSSIFSTGKVVATVTDGGLVTFKNKGKATILVSPDSEQVIEGILKFVNYFYELKNTGTLDTDKIAKILIEYMGVDINRAVLAALLDAAFAIYDIVGDTADPVQLTATAVEIIANIILQMKYNDSITFNVVDAQPITNFDIEGATSVKEGSQIQMSIVNVSPDAGDTSDITWSCSDPTIAYVDPNTGVITGLDAGGSLGNMSTQTCEITATSAANNVSKTVTLTVTGKTGRYLSYATIEGPDQVELDSQTDYGYAVYPRRVAEADNLYIKWGMPTGEDEEGNTVYTWADAENPVTDGIGRIDANGHYTAVSGGKSTIAMQATTGYYLSNGNFYEISSFTTTKVVSTGIPVESIRITAVDGTSNGDLNRDTVVNVNGEDFEYVTIHKGVMEAYAGNGCKFSASVYPETATNQNLTWVCDNNYYNQDNLSGDTHSVSYKQKAGHEVADTFNIYAVSADGKVKSNTITVCVTRNYVTSNVIDQDTIEVINGKTADVTHTLGFDGSWDGTAYACYKANWYSSDESIFSVATKTNDNRDGRITANDVGVATVYCVSADGGIMDTATVIVKPDKQFLKEIVDLCDNADIKRTPENKSLYQQYMKRLDLAYAVLYDQDMASQTTCDTYAQNLLNAFFKLGGFVGINSVDIKGPNKSNLPSDYVTVKVGSTANYTKSSYNFDYEINPINAMYSDVRWTSSNGSIKVDKNGKCTPTSNDACAAEITCTITDYMGNTASDTVTIAFARTKATGIELNTTSIVGARVGETQQLSASILPKNGLGSSTASVQSVNWASSDESVATVDGNGLITFVYGGDCEITATTKDGGHKAICRVNVVTNYNPLQLLITQYNDLQLNEVNYYPDTWRTFTQKKAEAEAMIARGGYSQKEVDAMYAELEEAYKGLKKYYYIQSVELYLDGEQTAEFYQYDLSLLKEGVSYKNAVLDLNVRLYPNNASYDSVSWESSTPEISVTTDGKCSPTANNSCYGMITCTVTDHFGNRFSDSVWVSFSYYPVTALVLSDSSINGLKGETHQLSCTVEPTGSSLLHIGKASIQDYYWESDDESVATVDENGLVTFVGAGSTIIRAVSYDGGVKGECKASTEGDRTALMDAINRFKDIDVTEYNYEYARAFQTAYAAAEAALTDYSMKQSDIDEAATNLVNAGEAMLERRYVKPTGVSLSYKTEKRPLVGSASQVATGSIGDSDALSINLSSNYSNYNNYNDLTITAAVLPSNAMYKSFSWSVDETTRMDTSIDGARIKLTPSKRDEGGFAKLRCTTVDHYDRVVTRVIYVVMADKVATGMSINVSSVSLLATDPKFGLNCTFTGSPEFTGVVYTSSDNSVCTVDSSGYIQPVERGNAVVTARSVDGGFTKTVNVTIRTDYSRLALKVNEYGAIVENAKGKKVYTEDTLAVLEEAVNQATTIVNEERGTQAEADSMLETLNAAYDGLIKYEAVSGIVLGYEAADAISEPNRGYLRYKGTTLNGKQIQLTYNLLPNNYAVYDTITFTSSNPDVSVDSYGLVTNTTGTAKYSVITCTVKDALGNEYSQSFTVSFVRYEATAVTFDEEIIYGAPQQTKKITPKLNQSNTTIPGSRVDDCKYSSSNTSVATVDENGVVTFLTQGTAVITVTACDGGYTGTINAYTTWDTTALQEAISEAEKIDYTAYAYEQGSAFKSALDNAKVVYADVYASQQQIDDACANLQTAITNLEGHPYVAATPVITVNGAPIVNNNSYEVDDDNQVVVNASVNSDAMIKSAVLSTSNENNVTVTNAENGDLIITKGNGSASTWITLTITDCYDRNTVLNYNINLVNQIINITSFNLTVNGAEVTSSTYSSTGYKYGYSDFAGLQLGYAPTPADASDPTSIVWTSSASNYVAVSDSGLVTLTTAGKIRQTNTAVITCTITNADGTVLTKTLEVTIAR